MPGEIKRFCGEKRRLTGTLRWGRDSRSGGLMIHQAWERCGGKWEDTWQAAFLEAGVFGKRSGWCGCWGQVRMSSGSFYWGCILVGKGESHHFVIKCVIKIIHISCSDLISSSTYEQCYSTNSQILRGQTESSAKRKEIFYNCIYFWPCWVFVAAWLCIVASCWPLLCSGSSLLWSTSSRTRASVVAHGVNSCSPQILATDSFNSCGSKA